MTEKRKSKRIDVDMTLKISDLFKQDNVKIENIGAPIKVTNISKSGIGFETNALLPVGYTSIQSLHWAMKNLFSIQLFRLFVWKPRMIQCTTEASLSDLLLFLILFLKITIQVGMSNI